MTPQQQHEKLLLACQRLAGSYHAEAALSGIVHALHDICGATAAAVVLREEETGSVLIKSCRGLSAHFCQQFARRGSDKALTDVIDGQQEVFLDDCAAEAERAEALTLEKAAASLACAPVITPGRSVGYVYVARDPARAFTGDERNWIRVFAHLAAAAVDRGELVRLRHDQPIDPETHVYNFHHFCLRLNEEVERGRRLSRPTAVLLMSIEGLEAYENTHGHDAAAALFARCVQAVGGSLRQIDLLGRFGTHQLVACLIESTAKEAEAVSRRLRENTADLWPADHPQLCLRIGLTSLVRDGQQAMDLLEEAQRNLHRSAPPTADTPGAAED